MRLMHFAALLGLLAFMGCEENGVDRDIPETMPGQYDSDVEVEDDPLLNDDPILNDDPLIDNDPLIDDDTTTLGDPGYTPPANNDPALGGSQDPTNLNTGDIPPTESGNDPDVVKEVGDGDQP